MKNYYKILSVESHASIDEIKKSYRRLANLYHPDKNQGNLEFQDKFIEITEAYQVLSDVDKRAEYDLEFSQQTATYANEPEYKLNHPVFYTQTDRSTLETPQQRPERDFFNQGIPKSWEFFLMPQRIGRILYAYSDSNGQKNKRSVSQANFVFGAFIFSLLGILALIVFYPSAIWVASLYVVSLAAVLLHNLLLRRVDTTNYYVGLHGFAEFKKANRTNKLNVNFEAKFSDIAYMYIHESSSLKYTRHESQELLFTCFNAYGKIVFAKRIIYSSNIFQKQRRIRAEFCKIIYRQFNLYMIDNMTRNFNQQGGVLYFYIYIDKMKQVIPYLQLRKDSISFTLHTGQAYHFSWQEIDNVYLKKNLLHIVMKDKKQASKFPIEHLCNRLYFTEALKAISGYNISY